MLGFPGVWELIERFKERCGRKGWKVGDYEDIIKAGGEYHYIIWARRIHPKTFERVNVKDSLSVREGPHPRRVKISYIAWVLHGGVDGSVLEAMRGNPDFLGRVAVYDVSKLYKGERVCLKLNRTGSIVFQEFERFLNEEFKVEFRRIPEGRRLEVTQLHG